MNDPLIVGITSLPSRIGRIRPCLESLLAGARIPDKILLALPAFSVREQSGYAVPDFLTDPAFCRGIVEVVAAGRDWGPGTKLLGALARLPAAGYLVVADDDVRYRPEFLQNLFVAQSRDHGASFSHFIGRSNGFAVGQGCDGLSFWIPNLAGIGQFAEDHVVDTELFFHDDLWISFYLLARGIPVKSLAHLVQGSIYEQVHELNALRSLKGTMKRRVLNRKGTRRLLKEVPLPLSQWLAIQAGRHYYYYIQRHARAMLRSFGAKR